jgi:uncharacterized protein YacL
MQKYALEIVVATVLYCVVLSVSLRWLKLHTTTTSQWKYVMAVLPVFPALLFPLAVLRLFRTLDELQQKIQKEGIVYAFTGTLVLTLLCGFLENAGLPRLSWIYVTTVMGICYALGIAIAKVRYR